MNRLLTTIFCFFLIIGLALGKTPFEKSKSLTNGGIYSKNLAEQNLLRAIQIMDSAVAHYFIGNEMAMARFYNPFTEQRSDEKGSIWMYTSSIEAVNGILHGINALKEQGKPKLFKKYNRHFTELLNRLYENAAFYKGTFTLTSFTQTREWTVYGVDRAQDKMKARVHGIYNVYDDQEWLIRELLEAYTLTNQKVYLQEAEYLTEYVLDGWDCVPDENGQEYGGIPWGPGYVTKHSCSNGPFVSPLVWLHELYKDKPDLITHRYIDGDGRRKSVDVKKSEYYLSFAEKIYHWQKNNLLRNDGVYDDMMGGCDPDCGINYENIDGGKYRKHNPLRNRVGPAISYNSGTMLSGAADLYRATQNGLYFDDARKLTDDSFNIFAKQGLTLPGYYTFDITGFRNWFNGVLLRGYVDVYPICMNSEKSIDSFQRNLDYAYEHFFYRGFLPVNLLEGWDSDKSKNNVEGMFSFSFAAQYAVLASFELGK